MNIIIQAVNCAFRVARHLYKILVVAVIGSLIMFSTYSVCSKFAQLPAIDQYLKVDWLLRKIISQIDIFGVLADFINNISDTAINITRITEIDIIKETFNALVVVAFLKLETILYNLLTSLTDRIFGKNTGLISKIMDFVCMLLMIMTAVLFSAIVFDTVYYENNANDYYVSTIAMTVIFVLLIAISIVLKPSYCAGNVLVKGVIKFIFEVIFNIFSVVAIYFTVLLYSEIRFYEHDAVTTGVFALLMIVAIGICTALFVNGVVQINPAKKK